MWVQSIKMFPDIVKYLISGLRSWFRIDLETNHFVPLQVTKLSEQLVPSLISDDFPFCAALRRTLYSVNAYSIERYLRRSMGPRGVNSWHLNFGISLSLSGKTVTAYYTRRVQSITFVALMLSKIQSLLSMLLVNPTSRYSPLFCLHLPSSDGLWQWDLDENIFNHFTSLKIFLPILLYELGFGLNSRHNPLIMKHSLRSRTASPSTDDSWPYFFSDLLLNVVCIHGIKRMHILLDSFNIWKKLVINELIIFSCNEWAIASSLMSNTRLTMYACFYIINISFGQLGLPSTVSSSK